MLDLKTAKLVMNKVNQYCGGPNITLEDAVRMQPLPQHCSMSGCTVLGLQRGDISILVWIQFNETLGTLIRNVRTIEW